MTSYYTIDGATRFYTAGAAEITMWAEEDADGWHVHMMIRLHPRRELFRNTTGPYATREVAEATIKQRMRWGL
jgi:hypothetical protein